MRVVAGVAGGRRLRTPPGRAVRPTSDRVREALFSSLESLGVVEGAVVADLFAGSGALGVEALSRGAARCTFVDADARALDAVRANLATTGLAGAATVVQADVLRWLEHAPPVDLALADPPYAFDRWADLLTRLQAAVAVLESNREVDAEPAWRVLRRKQYGGTVVTLMARDLGE